MKKKFKLQDLDCANCTKKWKMRSKKSQSQRCKCQLYDAENDC